MKAYLLSALLLCPSLHGISKEQEKARVELEIQKENDEMKIRIATIAALVTIAIIWLRGDQGSDDAATFDTMMLDILRK
ncbi:MAG TPA: hypothetical protein VL443_06405 [Cyclobacteriaceae bacterium]|jgi:hypothetical protein|nr:hypothetical protein [Cyclobacteriaceae bacterium]